MAETSYNHANKMWDSMTAIVHTVGRHMLQELYEQDTYHDHLLVKLKSDREVFEARDDQTTWEAGFCIGALAGSHTILDSYLRMIREGEPRNPPTTTVRNRSSIMGRQIARLRFAVADRVALHASPSHYGQPRTWQVGYDTGEEYAIDRTKGSLRAKFEQATTDSMKKNGAGTLWALGFAATREPYMHAISGRIGGGPTERLLEMGLIEPQPLYCEGQEY